VLNLLSSLNDIPPCGAVIILPALAARFQPGEGAAASSKEDQGIHPLSGMPKGAAQHDGPMPILLCFPRDQMP